MCFDRLFQDPQTGFEEWQIRPRYTQKDCVNQAVVIRNVRKTKRVQNEHVESFKDTSKSNSVKVWSKQRIQVAMFRCAFFLQSNTNHSNLMFQLHGQLIRINSLIS